MNTQHHTSRSGARRRWAAGAAAVAVATGAVAAGTASASSDEEVTLSYFTFSAAPDHLEDLDAIVSAFEAENPTISIEVQTAAYDDYFTSLQTQIAGGTSPDTFELNYESFVTTREAVRCSTSPITLPTQRATTRWRSKDSRMAACSSVCQRRSPTSCSSTTRTCSTPPDSTIRRPTGRGRTNKLQPRH